MRLRLCVLALLCVTCGQNNTYHMPLSGVSSLPLTPSGQSQTGGPGTGGIPPAGPKNIGTQVWLTPVPAGDLINALQHPELWSKAQKRVDVFSFYQFHAYTQPGFQCGKPCGPNTYDHLVPAVPGGAFKRIQDLGMTIGVQGASVKEYACTEAKITSEMVHVTLTALDNITSTGAKVSYLVQDDPFAAGTGNNDPMPAFISCGLNAAQTAELIKVYVDGIHQKYPNVQIGLDDPYPFFSVDEIINHLLELERLGVLPPFLHIDFDADRVAREQKPVASDMRRLHEFCQARGIAMGAIIFGANGTSNEKYAAGATASARMLLSALGVTEHTVFESWAEDPPGDLTSLKHIPDIVPETNPATHSGQLLSQLALMNIQPTVR